MTIRIATPEDIEYAREHFHRRYKFDFPDLSNAICSIVLLDGDKIIGFAVLRHLIEAIMMVGDDKRERAVALSEFIKLAKYRTQLEGHDGFHAFISDKDFAEILKKHFGFEKAKGEVLYAQV